MKNLTISKLLPCAASLSAMLISPLTMALSNFSPVTTLNASFNVAEDYTIVAFFEPASKTPTSSEVARADFGKPVLVGNVVLDGNLSTRAPNFFIGVQDSDGVIGDVTNDPGTVTLAVQASVVGADYVANGVDGAPANPDGNGWLAYKVNAMSNLNSLHPVPLYVSPKQLNTENLAGNYNIPVNLMMSMD